MTSAVTSKPSANDPLVQLSVHTLPSADGARQLLERRTRMGRIKMLLVWAVCAAPVVASYFTFYVLRPQGRSNYGELIVPTRPMPPVGQLPLANLQGQGVLPAALKGQWLLVSVGGGACDGVCERQLYLQRQLREMLGKDKDRVDRVWLVTDQAAVPTPLLPALQQAWTLRADPAAVARWLQPQAGQALSAHFYLVDPRGDWMMRFPAQADPVRIKKDLGRLLKASESWDKAGR
jgi:cytochrome oxidase Cu insertion factor (SCO1/SenC/PrrC family)